MLDDVQQNLLQKRGACIKVVKTWDEFVEALGQKKMILALWCDEEEVEKDVKTRTKGEMGAAKTLCSPLDQPELHEGTLCSLRGKPAKKVYILGQKKLYSVVSTTHKASFAGGIFASK